MIKALLINHNTKAIGISAITKLSTVEIKYFLIIANEVLTDVPNGCLYVDSTLVRTNTNIARKTVAAIRTMFTTTAKNLLQSAITKFK